MALTDPQEKAHLNNNVNYNNNNNTTTTNNNTTRIANKQKTLNNINKKIEYDKK